MLISTVADKFSVRKLMKMFNCSRKIVELAKSVSSKDIKSLEKLFNQDPVTRERLDVNKVEHFINFIFTAGFIQDVAFGTTKITLSSGKSFDIPHAVRTLQRSHIVSVYQEYCNSVDIQPLSARSLWRVLDTCKASQRKGIQGLDEYIAEGVNGFDTLKDVIGTCGTDPAMQTVIQKNILTCKQYLKASYPTHVMSETSMVASHCRVWALSDPSDEELKQLCTHEHTEICLECNLLMSTLSTAKKLVQECQDVNKEELVYEVNHAVNSILEWQKHILRGSHQEFGKGKLLEMLDGNTIYWLRDWGMKILPQKFRETMQEWFGKRGISNHIDCIFYIDENGIQKKVTYITLTANCTQDMYAVLCIFKHVLQQIRKDFPHVSRIVDRSDNAGCYSTVNVIAGKAAIAQNMGVKILRSEFNEPQCGKDQCDRDSAVIKKHIKGFLHSGHDTSTSNDIYEALLSSGGIRNIKPSVIDILHEECSVEKMNVEGISSYHSASFQYDEGIKFWHYHGVGQGKQTNLKLEDVKQKLKFDVIKPFPEEFPPGKPFQKKKAKKQELVLFCPDVQCVSTFSSIEDMDIHILEAQHTTAAAASTPSDKVKMYYVKKMKTEAKILLSPSISGQSSTSLASVEMQTTPYDIMGWAIKKRKIPTFLTLKQKIFLYEAFMQGEETGRKIRAETLVQKMKKAVGEDGAKLFSVAEYITKQQVMSQFSILSSRKKNQTLHSYLKPKKNTPEDGRDDDEEEWNLATSVKENYLEEEFSTIADIQQKLSISSFKNKYQPSVEIDQYYGVYYTTACYVGKALSWSTTSQKYEVKFLHKIGVNQYDWPKRPDIEELDSSVIFYGPLCITGMPPFELPTQEAKDLKECYQKFKKELKEQLDANQKFML